MNRNYCKIKTTVFMTKYECLGSHGLSSTSPSGNSSVKELAHLYKQRALERLGSSKGKEKNLAKTMLVIAAHLHWALGMVACSLVPLLLNCLPC